MDDDAAADGARVDDTAAQLVVFTTTPTSTVRLALRAGACGGGLCSLLPSNTSTDMSVQLKIKAMSYTSMYRGVKTQNTAFSFCAVNNKTEPGATGRVQWNPDPSECSGTLTHRSAVEPGAIRVQWNPGPSECSGTLAHQSAVEP
ncbi:unnamed protein product [Gadus morhua 'NCC']